MCNNRISDEVRGLLFSGSRSSADPSTDDTHTAGMTRVEGNDFEACSRFAICIQNGANPTILRNRIHGGRWGIVAQTRAFGVIMENDIFANSRPGIGIKTHANPLVEKNKIHHGLQMGLLCNDNGKGQIRHNEFFCNSHAAITIKNGANPFVYSNAIHNEKRGVAISDNGAGIVDSNHIFNFTKTGITIKSGGRPLVRNNCIHGGKQGLTMYENAEGIVEGNEFFNNSTLNLGLQKGGNTLILINLQGRIRASDGQRLPHARPQGCSLQGCSGTPAARIADTPEPEAGTPPPVRTVDDPDPPTDAVRTLAGVLQPRLFVHRGGQCNCGCHEGDVFSLRCSLD